MSIDISTHQLAEITATAMGGGTKIDEVLTVWHGIGLKQKPLLENIH
jgi:hypothetical protein